MQLLFLIQLFCVLTLAQRQLFLGLLSVFKDYIDVCRHTTR